MDQKRLSHLLDKFPKIKILVFGDFFLDQYLIIDKSLQEVSIETDLTAHQVVSIRNSPGVAGTVTNNLRALDVLVLAMGLIGVDGRGFDLKKGLVETGVNIQHIIESTEHMTPTYTKPMLRELDGSENEIERLDIKDRTPLSIPLENEFIDRLNILVPQVDGVILINQVPETNCSVMTDQIRVKIAALALQYPEKYFLVDSRKNIALFENMIIKCNLIEAQNTLGFEIDAELTIDKAIVCGKALFTKNQRPVIITLGEMGVLVCEGGICKVVPAITVQGPIDIVGAGDSAIAAITAALCAGATLEEAGLVGNLVASITIQQIGTTGTASREQVLRRFEEYGFSKKSLCEKDAKYII